MPAVHVFTYEEVQHAAANAMQRTHRRTLVIQCPDRRSPLGPPAQAATSNGPYYATPSWDQKLPASTRFVVLTDWNSEAVLDRETGLVWERAPGTNLVAHALLANPTCLIKSVGGRKGWRLPSISELASLIDPSVASPGPTLPAGHPFTTVESKVYWSATRSIDPNSDTLSLSWFVIFTNGEVSIQLLSSNGRAWCVRGGMNADAYVQ